MGFVSGLVSVGLESFPTTAGLVSIGLTSFTYVFGTAPYFLLASSTNSWLMVFFPCEMVKPVTLTKMMPAKKTNVMDLFMIFFIIH